MPHQDLKISAWGLFYFVLLDGVYPFAFLEIQFRCPRESPEPIDAGDEDALHPSNQRHPHSGLLCFVRWALNWLKPVVEVRHAYMPYYVFL